ncbi:hypothetical protein GCM10028777_18740 [Angustibacter speluncae]
MTSLPERRSRRWVVVTVVLVLAWLGVLVGAGTLLGGPLAKVIDQDNAWSVEFEEERTTTLNEVTHWWSTSADTAVIIGTALVVGLVMLAVWRRWVEPLLVWAAVALQSSVFLTTTLLVSRERPSVEKLDPAPPTSSFPSGHTGASTALYLSIGLVLASHVRNKVGRVAVVVLLLLVPLGVAVSRLYRGMHFPTDVLFGALNGTVAVLIVRQAVLGWREDDARPQQSGEREHSTPV